MTSLLMLQFTQFLISDLRYVLTFAPLMVGSPGLVVMGADSQSQRTMVWIPHRLLDGHFSHICLVCFKPMAPLHYWDTPYLDKLWYLKEKTRSIKTIFYFKRHKCRRRTKSLQKLFKGCKAAKSFERSFWDFACF